MINEMVFYAGIMDADDIWSQEFDSPDWKLIKDATFELQADTAENLLKRKLEKEHGARTIFVGIMKSMHAFSNTEEDLIEAANKIFGNNTDFHKVVKSSGMNKVPKMFNVGIIKNIFKTKKQSVAQIFEEWELAIADPNYKTLANLVHAINKMEPKSNGFLDLTQNGIGSNYKIYLRPNCMKDIFYLDPYDPEHRPVVLRESSELKVNALDMFPHDIFDKNADMLAIRIVNKHF